MKKLLFLAALTAVFSASAEDMWLRWMIDEGATIDEGTIPTTVYAKVKNGDTDEYLSLYTSPDNASGYGNKIYTVDMTDSMPTFAGFTGTAPASFVIELYNDANCAEGSWVGQSVGFTYSQANLTTGGMTKASPASAISFTAAPEPTSGMLLLIGVAGLALRRRKIRVA